MEGVPMNIPAPRRPSHPLDRLRLDPGGDGEERTRGPRRGSVKDVKHAGASGLKAED
jgi:hypothetical protein